MSNMLSDGTVLASWMKTVDRGVVEDSGYLTNLALRQGEVIKLYYTDSANNQNKKVIEYDVAVQHRDGSGPLVTSVYRGCTLANLFGGAADVLTYTLRPDDGTQAGETGVGVGSKVLLLCINGQLTNAVILGGIRDLKVDTHMQEPAADGHNLRFEFNGTSVVIDDHGQLLLKRRGATKGSVDSSGVPDLDPDKNATADKDSHLDFLENGNIEMYTHSNGESILLDEENELASFSFVRWEARIDHAAEFHAGQDFTIQSDQAVHLDHGDGVIINNGSEKMMLGSTFRQDQQSMHNSIVSALTVAATQLQVAAGLINTAAGALAAPITGGPASSAPLTSAGVALQTAGGKISEAVSAITQFESAAAGHLSVKNRLD